MPRPRLDDLEPRQGKGRNALLPLTKPKRNQKGEVRWARRLPPVDLPDSLWVRLAIYMDTLRERGEGTTRAEVVRSALREFLNRRRVPGGKPAARTGPARTRRPG